MKLLLSVLCVLSFVACKKIHTSPPAEASVRVNGRLFSNCSNGSELHYPSVVAEHADGGFTLKLKFECGQHDLGDLSLQFRLLQDLETATFVLGEAGAPQEVGSGFAAFLDGCVYRTTEDGMSWVTLDRLNETSREMSGTFHLVLECEETGKQLIVSNGAFESVHY